MRNIIIIIFSNFFCSLLISQNNSWQQRAQYDMKVKMNVKKFQYIGKQTIKYTNNSPDKLNKIYFHLYWNAFQPGSVMDLRLQNIADPDKRMVNNVRTVDKLTYESKISKLKSHEIGYQKITKLLHNGNPVNYRVDGTILEVFLNDPIQQNSTSSFYMEWNSQVPLTIRRAGRQNKEGVEFSMTQWYPKIAAYDALGWHLDEYIAREFHGVFADFNVSITIDKEYVVGASGVLQNPLLFKGYGGNPSSKLVTYEFKAENIHDFAWAADPDYIVKEASVPNGPKLYFIYQENNASDSLWIESIPLTIKFFNLMSKHFGEYPYPNYTVIQGGDGGMEYGAITLIVGYHKNIERLSNLIFHEAAHSWFQHVLATDEARYAWMDEGFTSFAENFLSDQIFQKNQLNPWISSYYNYIYLVKNNLEEPMSIHSDFFQKNISYSISSYSKGSIFLSQLLYIVGNEVFNKIMLQYFETWKFRHPAPIDFIRIAEKNSGMDLKWYLNHWVYSTNSIDYGIESVKENNISSIITLRRIGNMPMPLDVYVELNNGKSIVYYIPLSMMRGEKSKGSFNLPSVQLPDWTWVKPTYSFEIPYSKSQIKSITIDKSTLLADINRENNSIIN